MDSVAERITKAILDILKASPPTGHSIQRYRTTPVPESGRNVTLLYPAAGANGDVETPTRMDFDGGVEATRIYRTETLIDPGETPPDEALDPYFVWLVTVMLEEPLLGGLVEDVRRGPMAYGSDERGRPTGQMIIQWEVDYQSAEEDPTREL